MGQALFVDRKKNLNELYALLFHEQKKFLCYRAASGYGITAFFHRFCYLFQATENTVCLFAELSDNARSPLHEILKKIVVRNGNLYHKLQRFADDRYGEEEEPLLKSMILDLPVLGETTANLLFNKPVALPIYSGYYSDALKQFFFEMVKEELSDKKVLIFIDNAQYIDNESVSDILALQQLSHVAFILSQTEDSSILDKLLLEASFRGDITFLDFPEPPVACVKEILANNDHPASDGEAIHLIKRTNGNIRKIIFEVKHLPSQNEEQAEWLPNEILSLLYILQSNICLADLMSMLKESPTCSVYTEPQVLRTVRYLIYKGFISSVVQMDGKEIFWARIRYENQNVWDLILSNPADKLIYQDIVYRYLAAMNTHTLDELKNLFVLSKSVAVQYQKIWGKALLIESLQQGMPVQGEWIEAVKETATSKERFLCALCMFRMWKFKETLEALTLVWPEMKESRDVKLLLALTLNRCRKHSEADQLLQALIKTSHDIDEKTILLSIAISNCVHSGNEAKAKQIVLTYETELSESKVYGYFLRNSATLFQGETANSYWEKSIAAFQSVDDEYGELTTMVNMSRVHIRNGNFTYAKSCMNRAYNGLLPYGIEQLHIAANNLGIAYTSCGDYSSAKRYLRIAKLIAKSIMPKVYITINECCILLEYKRQEDALNALLEYAVAVDSSNIPRLKSRYYLALAGVYCILGRFHDTLDAIEQSNQYSTGTFLALRERIANCCKNEIHIPANNWREYFSPAFLEYWIANPFAIMSKDVLSG